MPRYDDSPRDRSPIDRRERGRIKSPTDRRRGRDSSMNVSSRGARDPYDDYPPRVRSEYAPYKILCISNLNHKFSDTAIREALNREFSRYGDVSVKVCHDDNERIAYIYFRSYDEAREARHAKSRLILFDKPVDIEPIYDHHRGSSMSASSGRKRSVTPPYGPLPSRSRGPPGSSPPPRSRAPPPPPMSQMRNSSDKYGPAPYSRQNQRPSNDMRSGNDYHHHHQQGNANRQQHRESKKEKFPNYLHHIPPEDDDKATRTLFVGNLEVSILEPDLKRIFERYGVVEDIDVKRPPPGQGNAYAFIKFLNLDMAHKAKVEMSGQYIGKFQCKIGYGKATPTTRIWVGGLGPWTSLSHLEREFDRFGSIGKIDFVKGDNHAYIQYDSIDAAQAACQEMRGHALGGPDKRLRVDFADPGPYNSNYNSPTRPANTTTPTPAPRYPPSDYDGYSDKGGSRQLASNNSGDEFSGSEGEEKPEKESIKTRPSVWSGGLILKNSAFPAKMYLCSGDKSLIEIMRDPSSTDVPMLKITQRLRLDPLKLEDVSRRMYSAGSSNYCVLYTASEVNNNQFQAELGEDGRSVQTRPLKHLVSYLKQKEAAGVISLVNSAKEIIGVLYAFPPCPFATELLRKNAPNIATPSPEDDYLLVVVVRGTN